MTAHILLVEDNNKLATYISNYLREIGYDVSHESRGDDAIFHIQRIQPDIVILDVMLPGVDGIQVCQSIRDSYRGMILMLTALNEDEDQITGLASGADDYIVKPIDPKVLAARIEALLRRNTQKTPIRQKAELSFGCLHIDLIARSASLSGVEIALKPLEFDLLVFLANNADCVVSRDTIMRSLRGTDFDGIDRTIDLRVSYLRKKLSDHPDTPYRIKTIRAKGYVFISTAWD